MTRNKAAPDRSCKACNRACAACTFMGRQEAEIVVNTIANASQQRYLRLMYVCICNAIKEDELREIARHGVTCPEAAYAVLGKAPQCRTCLDHADDVMGEERERCAGRCPSRGGLAAPASATTLSA